MTKWASGSVFRKGGKLRSFTMESVWLHRLFGEAKGLKATKDIGAWYDIVSFIASIDMPSESGATGAQRSKGDEEPGMG
jgi:hypothetical protein